jgi:nonsense-mediated mRNA decay protein 3
MLKHNAHRDTINIKESKDGLDFYFSQRNHAEKLVDFLQSVTPIRLKKSQELISMDIHTSVRAYKITFSAELIPICKDDLVALPPKLARSLGNIHPLTLCFRVGTSITLLDPTTLQTADVPSAVYWRQPFRNLADVQGLVEFVVMDIEPVGESKGRFFLAEITVARASEMGVNDNTYFTRTHLGGVLHVGDSVLGYHLTGANFNDSNFDAIQESSQYGSTIPDVVLVKKFYARKKKPKSRSWKLKRMALEDEEEPARKQDANRLEADFEMFLRDIEEDQDLRSTLSLYKAQNEKRRADNMDVVEEKDEMEEDSSEDEAPKIDMDELLDEFDELNMADAE